MTGARARRARAITLGVVAVGCVALQFPGRLGPAAAALGAWLVALAALARPALARLWRPRFLLVTVAVALLAGVLLGPRDTVVCRVGLSTAGLRAGALMVVRGLLVFALTAWGATLVVAAPRRGARGALGAAIAAAVALVPDLTARLRASWAAHAAGGRWRAVRAVAAELVVHAAAIAEEMAAGEDAPSGGAR